MLAFKNNRQPAKQDHVGITELPDFTTEVEQMDQTARWSLDPSVANSELQQQDNSGQIP